MGECCEDIGLDFSPEQIKNSYFYWLKRGETKGDTISKKFENNRPDPNWHTDIHLIYPMLIFIRADHTHPEIPSEKHEKVIYHYTCKHFDKKKKICTIYEFRPTMCRTYPDFGYCRNPKCRWKKQVELRKKAEVQRKEKGKLRKNLRKNLKEDIKSDCEERKEVI